MAARGPEWCRANCSNEMLSSSPSIRARECCVGRSSGHRNSVRSSLTRERFRSARRFSTFCVSDRAGTGSRRTAGVREAARVLTTGGWWAAWWNHPWADAEEWFDAFLTLLESRCSGYSRHSRDVDWCAEAIAASDLFHPPQRHAVSWDRRVSVEDWLVDLRSHSYVIDLGEPDASALIADVESILRGRFSSAIMTVPYETRLWTAQRC